MTSLSFELCLLGHFGNSQKYAKKSYFGDSICIISSSFHEVLQHPSLLVFLFIQSQVSLQMASKTGQHWRFGISATGEVYAPVLTMTSFPELRLHLESQLTGRRRPDSTSTGATQAYYTAKTSYVKHL